MNRTRYSSRIPHIPVPCYCNLSWYYSYRHYHYVPDDSEDFQRTDDYKEWVSRLAIKPEGVPTVLKWEELHEHALYPGLYDKRYSE